MQARPALPPALAPAPARQRWGMAAAALLAHALLLLALHPLLRSRPPALVSGPSPAGQLVLLWPSGAAPAKEAQAQVRPTARPAPMLERPARWPAVTPPAPKQPPTASPAATLVLDSGPLPPPPATPPGVPPVVPAAQPAAQATATAPTAAPLQLSLPRTDPASAPPNSWVRRDQRLGEPVSRSERFAQTLGTDQTERRDTLSADGATRIRRGTECTLVKSSRDSQLDPFNQSTRAAPKQSGAC